MMKRRHPEQDDSGTWMNTYSDLVTLLLTFFVLMFSFSSVDAEKWQEFIRAFTNPGEDTSQVVLDVDEIANPADSPFPNESTGGQGSDGMPPTVEDALPEDFDSLYLYLQKFVEEKKEGDSIQVMKSGSDVIYIRFQNDIFFDPDEYYLKPSASDILNVIGDGIHNVEDEIYIISINGHTAQVQDPNYIVSDWMLSSERASSVAIYFEEEKGIAPQKMRPMGYGKNYPIASNDTPEGREKNRRVDMTIIKNTGDLDDDPDLDQALASLFDPDKFPKSGGAKELFEPDTAEDPQAAPA